MTHVYRPPYLYAQRLAARVDWQVQPFWVFDGISDTFELTERIGGVSGYAGNAFTGISDTFELTENTGTVTYTPVITDNELDVAAASAERAPIRHPGWQRKQAMDQVARERAMERKIRATLRGETESPAIKVEVPRQRTAAQMAAEMAAAQAARAARNRANEAAMEAQRARVEIERLQPELVQRRQAASYRVIESLLRQM